MSELVPRSDHLPRPDYSFEELEAAIELAPLVPLENVSNDYKHVGQMMVSHTSDYFIFVNEEGMFIKALVQR